MKSKFKLDFEIGELFITLRNLALHLAIQIPVFVETRSSFPCDAVSAANISSND